MLWIIMVIAMAVCMVVASVYYYILLKRFISMFQKELKKIWKILLAVAALVLGLCSGTLFSTMGVILVHIAVVALLMELVNLLVKKASKGNEHRVWTVIYKSLVIPILTVGIIFAYGYYNIRDVRETSYTITTEKEVKQNCRVLLITDAHYGTIFEGKGLRELKERMSKIQPDVVILGGDLVDESTTKEQMQELFEELGSIPSRYGIYYVYGNHDRQSYSSDKYFSEEELSETITAAGIRILQDECVEITEGITLAGREDYSRSRKTVSELLADVSPEDYIIVADHQPVEYAENEAAGTDLIVSGHTHAGQLFPVGLVMKVFHTSDLWYGHIREGGMDAVVSSGVAGWGYPIRTQEHSEYTVIDIVSG